MKDVIEKFYKAFDELDAEKMVECYHKDIIFEDPAFGVLNKKRAMNMWRMLCSSQKGKDFKIVYSNIESNENKGSAKWEAFYTFSQTGRKVHNKISATFEFKDNLIIKHNDSFDIYTWSKQAIGIKGFILGFTSFFKSKLQIQTGKLLDKFISKQL